MQQLLLMAGTQQDPRKILQQLYAVTTTLILHSSDKDARMQQNAHVLSTVLEVCSSALAPTLKALPATELLQQAGVGDLLGSPLMFMAAASCNFPVLEVRDLSSSMHLPSHLQPPTDFSTFFCIMRASLGPKE